MQEHELPAVPSSLIRSSKARLGLAIELGLVATILILYLKGVRPIASGTTLFLFPLAWISLRLRKLRWRDVGFRIPAQWKRQLAIGVLVGTVWQGYSLFIEAPLLKRLGLPEADVSSIERQVSTWSGFLVMMVMVWVFGAMIEEMTFRGYLLTRLSELRRGRLATAGAVLGSAGYFGLSHWYQGPSGAISAATGGIVDGLLYLVSGCNLFLPAIAHGTLDTIGIIFLARGYHGP